MVMRNQPTQHTYNVGVGGEGPVVGDRATAQPLFLRCKVAAFARLANGQRLLVVGVGLVGVHHRGQRDVDVGVIIDAALQPISSSAGKLAGGAVFRGGGTQQVQFLKG